MQETNCCECGVRIYIEDNYYNTLKNTHKSFHCINGHGQHFTGKSDAEKQKEINQIIKEESNKRIAELKDEIYELRDKTKHCSECGKFFSSTYALNRHIQNLHNPVKRSEK